MVRCFDAGTGEGIGAKALAAAWITSSGVGQGRWPDRDRGDLGYCPRFRGPRARGQSPPGLRVRGITALLRSSYASARFEPYCCPGRENCTP